MEMISAKTAYLDSLAGYTDELEKIKEQIFEVIQLANAEGKFQATYSIEQCPQEIINWLGEYGYTVIIEDGYIQIDWGNALVDEADLQVQVDEQDIDPTDIDNTAVEEQIINNGTSQEQEEEKEGLKEIYISQASLQGYRVNNIIVYSGEPVENINGEGVTTVTYNSYFHLLLTNDDTGDNRFANLWISRDAASPTGIGGSMTALIEGSCDKKGAPLVFLNVPMEHEAIIEGNVEEDTSTESAEIEYFTQNDLNSQSAQWIGDIANTYGYAFSNETKTALINNYLTEQSDRLAELQQADVNAELPGSRTDDELRGMTVKAILDEMQNNIYDITPEVKNAIIQDFLKAQRLAKFYYENDFVTMNVDDILNLSEEKGYNITAGVKTALIADIIAGGSQIEEITLNEKTIAELLDIAEEQSYDIGDAKQEAVRLFLDAQGTNSDGEEEQIIPIIEKVYLYYEVNSNGSPYIGTIPFEANNIFASTISTPPSSIIKPNIYEYILHNDIVQ